MFSPTPRNSSASAAAAPRAPAADYSVISLSQDFLAPPTLEQLAGLQALPAAMAVGMNRKYKSAPEGVSRKGKSSGRAKATTRGVLASPALARDGQIVSKPYNAYGNRPYPNNGLSLVQSVQLEEIINIKPVIITSATTGLPVFYSKTFQASDFAGTSNLVTVFDQYRIDQLECWFDFMDLSVPGNYPAFMTTVDLDDANTPTSVGQISDKLGAVVTAGPSGHYHKWRPHIAVASYSGAFTSYSNVPSGWIDSASPSVQHFGIKAATVSTGSAFQIAMTVRAVISFRAPAIN